jgi:bidirectional [NiFe] hydrogenase diaphorase subunit
MPEGTARPKTLRIDGRDVGASGDQTVLQVARENGIEIPTLCAVERLSKIGACRLCLVEVKGSPRLFPACTTLVWEGMEVLTDSPRLKGYRRLILEFLFTERNHVCAVCVSNGHCKLQDLAKEQGMTRVRVPYRSRFYPVDMSHDRFVLDHNRCVLCTRCLRVCDEMEGAHTWDLTGRGVGTRVITDLNQPWGSSETCTSCGKCVQVCPTGALSEKGRSVAEMFKKRRFLSILSPTGTEEPAR